MTLIKDVSLRHYEDFPHQLLLDVTTENGATGTGECWWGMPNGDRPGSGARPIVQVVEALITPRVLGRDARHIGRLWHELADHFYRYGDGGMLPMGIAGLDLALWDLRGKSLGVPVVELLGGAVHDAIPAYASLPPLHTTERVLHEIARAKAHGFRAAKLHEHALDIITEVASGAPNGFTLMLDVNGHYDLVEAIDVAQVLGELGYYWFEEPVRPMRDHRSIRKVADASPVRLAGGENEFSLIDFERFLTSSGVTYLQPEITKIGGLTPATRVSALAELHNVVLCPHNFRLGPSLLASIHWGFSSPITQWLEIPWLPEGNDFPSGVTVPALEDGAVRAPTGLGLALGH